MVKVKPFAGYMPNKELTDKIVSLPYDVLDRQEARNLAKDNECSFYRVNKPEIEFPDDVSPYDKCIYEKGKENLEEFITKGYLNKDDCKRMYIYGMKMGDHQQYGIICMSSIEDYEDGKIKIHEHTLQKKEEDRTKLCYIQNANVGPVFLTFKGGEQIVDKINEVIKGDMEYDMVADDGIRHMLWKIPEEDSLWLKDQFAGLPATYVADGHHRAAAAYNVGKMKREQAIAEGIEITGEEEFNYFMTLIIPIDQLLVMDYNRVFKSLNGYSEAEFEEKLSEKFTIEEFASQSEIKPSKKWEFSLYIGGKWKKMTAKEEFIKKEDPVLSLDAAIIGAHVLEDILNIMDVRNDNRVDFVGGIRGLKELETRCNTDCVAAIALYATDMNDLIKVADEKLNMPPKSTWFEPKPRSGLVVRVFEPEAEFK